MADSTEPLIDAPCEPDPALRELPQPEPAPGREAYVRERELAIASDPRRRENYEKYMRSARRGANVDYMPIVLDIENISRCNFRCVMCTVSEFPKGKRARDMNLDEFKHIIDEQYGLVEIKLHGLGEPLLQGDVYYDMIRYARARHIWVRTVTNGSALHVNDNIRKLVDSGINEVQVSVDGADAETFEKIRRGSHFPRVAENCQVLNDYCQKKGILLTKMWTVVQQDNAHQLEQLVDFGANAGFPSMVFSLQMHGWGDANLEAANNRRGVDGRIDASRLTRLCEQGKSRGIKVAFWNITAKYSTTSRSTLCPWPFERAYVSSEGRTAPCCMVGNPDKYEIAAGLSLAEAWDGEEYREFRQRHIDGRLPEVCKACYLRSGLT